MPGSSFMLSSSVQRISFGSYSGGSQEGTWCFNPTCGILPLAHSASHVVEKPWAAAESSLASVQCFITGMQIPADPSSGDSAVCKLKEKCLAGTSRCFVKHGASVIGLKLGFE